MNINKIQNSLIDSLKINIELYASNQYLKEPVLNFTWKIKSLDFKFSFQKYDIENHIINTINVVNLANNKIVNDDLSKFLMNNNYRTFYFENEIDLVNKTRTIIEAMQNLSDNNFNKICNKNNNINFDWQNEISDLLYKDNLKIIKDSITDEKGRLRNFSKD
jgi:hypothetical protein